MYWRQCLPPKGSLQRAAEEPAARDWELERPAWDPERGSRRERPAWGSPREPPEPERGSLALGWQQARREPD